MSKGLGSVYADALYDAVIEDYPKGISQVYEQIRLVGEIFKSNPDAVEFLSSPSYNKQEKTKLINTAFSSFNPYLQNLLIILTSASRIGYFSYVLNAFLERYYKENNIVQAKVISAKALDEQIMQKIKNNIEEKTKRNVVLSLKIDASIIGGIIIEYEGKRIDGSLKARLDKFSREVSCGLTDKSRKG